MKRVKIMLTAITILAVVAGVLAFTAQRFTASAVFCSAIDANNNPICQFPGWQRVNNFQTPTTTGPCGVGISYYTTDAENCRLAGVAPAANKTLYPASEE
jgi:hypothetical protein